MSEEHESNEQKVATLEQPQRLYIVGIGASAGGLEALRELMSHLEYHPRLTFVIAQHLSPTHNSMLKTLLARECKLNVVDLLASQIPEPNTIYVIPPNTDVEISNGVFHLVKPKPGVGPKPSIDRLFSSLAQDQGENVIGIILSGTGGDGASGLLAIKSSGGATFVQDPNTAKYDGMPQAAIQSNGADMVLPPNKMGEALTSFVSAGVLVPDKIFDEASDIYEEILKVTKHLTGFNLSQYKTSTIERRIKRRMALYHHVEMDEYLQYMKDHKDEVEHFAKDVLISVTEFFRDPDSFDSLGKVINSLVENTPSHRVLRAWVPGCATGEEVYSIAILFEEAIRNLGVLRDYQIFATDIDANATNRGRHGRYSAVAFENMQAAWLKRYFEKEGGEYTATKALREHIVFSVHNLIQDPPFSRVDLISCRNLLIYFTTPLQKRVMEIFHYALNPNGVLFLGKSETVGHHEDLYTPLDKPKRIYRKIGDRSIYRPFNAPVEIRHDTVASPPTRKKDSPDPITLKVDQAIQKIYGPPSVVISTNDEVIHITGAISNFLTFQAGPAGLSIYDLINDKLRAELRALIYKCRREITSVEGGRHTIESTTGEEIALRMRVTPLEQGNSGLILICFESITERISPAVQDIEDEALRDNPVILELEHELTTTREHLQTVVEELETSNEELQSVNEELQSANEELQSTNEELQTSNEELQSTNEELLTVNDELQVKTRELESMALDLQNIQDSFDFPLIVVDKGLRIMRFVPAIDQLIPVAEIHCGDLISSLPWRDDVPRIRQKINKVIKTGKSMEDLVKFKERIYQMRIIPYRNKGSEVGGALLLFPDITELQNTKLGLQRSEVRLQNIIDHVVDGIIAIDQKGSLLTFSKAAERIFGYQAKEVLGKNVSILMPDSLAKIHNSHLRNYLKTGEAKALGTQREVIGKDKNGHEFPMELSVSEMVENGKHTFTALVRDITQRKAIDEALFKEKERALVTLHSIADGVITADKNCRIEFINAVAEQLTGWSQEDARNQSLGSVFKVIDEHTREPKTNPGRIVLETNEPVDSLNGTILRNKHGREHTIEHSASPICDKDGNINGVVVVFRDVTEKYHILRQMAWQARHDALTGLINRKEMENRIEHAITSAKSFNREHALLYIDLDQFKIVNDTCGHQAGDEMLRQVAGHLGTNLRHRDALSRLGGDEFAVLLENCTLSQAQQIAEAIKEAVGDYRFLWDDKVFKIGACIGVVSITSDSIDTVHVLSDADAACYAAKDAGRNRVQLHSIDDAELLKHRREMQWVSNINQVLEENRFRLYLQRIQPLDDQHGSHWEVLLRMLDNKGEIVLPGVFLPAAERYGLMKNVDRWVLRSTLIMMENIPSSAHDKKPNVSINLSGVSLGDEKMLGFVRDQFEALDVQPEQICFEITETAAIANFAKARKFMHALKKMGCQFALDDFGSGMSSFGYLKSLPINYIKIDGSFVRNIDHDLVDLAMVESINRIGSLMEIETIAEFAETDDIIKRLKQIGVGYAQGFGVQHPIKSEEFLVSV